MKVYGETAGTAGHHMYFNNVARWLEAQVAERYAIDH